MASQQPKAETISELNRKHFDKMSKVLFKEEWVKAIAGQVTDLVRSNLDWIDVRKQTDGGDPVKLLDFACGNGTISRALSDHFDVIRGADISQGMVDSYNEIAREANLPVERISAVRGDITATDEESRSTELFGPEYFDFDAAIISMALHHISEPELLLSKLVGRLRSDGVLVIIDWTLKESGNDAHTHSEHVGHQHSHHHGHHDHQDHHSHHAISEHDDPNPTITRSGFSSEEMHKLLTSAGCKPDSIDYRVYHEQSHIPESACKVKGGIYQTFFIAKGRKP